MSNFTATCEPSSTTLPTSRLALPNNELLDCIHWETSNYYKQQNDGSIMFESFTPTILIAFGT